ncbi:hypothetical protein AAVH_20504, partial [Aphelenchoides avenae]
MLDARPIQKHNERSLHFPCHPSSCKDLQGILDDNNAHASGCGSSCVGEKRTNGRSRFRKEEQHRKRVRRRKENQRKRLSRIVFLHRYKGRDFIVTSRMGTGQFRKRADINDLLTDLATRTKRTTIE